MLGGEESGKGWIDDKIRMHLECTKNSANTKMGLNDGGITEYTLYALY